MAACRLLAPGGVLVYATCTFAPEENEAVVSWLLGKMPGVMRLEPCRLDGVESCPALTSWAGRTYAPQVRDCLRVLPDGLHEGFFIARMVRAG